MLVSRATAASSPRTSGTHSVSSRVVKSAPQNDNTCAPPSELPAIITSLRIIVSTAARRVGDGGVARDELRLEILRQREVEEGIERIDAELVGDLLHVAIEEPLVLGPCDRLDAEGVPREHEGATTRVGELGRASASRNAGSRKRRSRSGDASVSVSRKLGISSNRNVDPSAKCTLCRLAANIGCSSRPSRLADSAKSRLRFQPSGAWGIAVNVLRCTGRPDARAIRSTRSRSASS